MPESAAREGRCINSRPTVGSVRSGTNLRGVYYCIRGLAPLMIQTSKDKARGGHIINISSLAGKNALPNGAA